MGAIRNTEELQLKRKKSSPVLTHLFGIEGELAGSALKAQRKALRTASLSLMVSFFAFTVMQCFFIISGIGTRETYFEKYQNVWDIMVTVKDTEIDTFGETAEIQQLSNVKNAIIYQKAMAQTLLAEDDLSEEMKSFGSFSHASANDAVKTGTGWRVHVPIVVMDDDSFLDFCEQIGITPQLDGAVVRNQIRDVSSSDFRHPRYMPYVKAENSTSILQQSD